MPTREQWISAVYVRRGLPVTGGAAVQTWITELARDHALRLDSVEDAFVALLAKDAGGGAPRYSADQLADVLELVVHLARLVPSVPIFRLANAIDGLLSSYAPPPGSAGVV